MPWKSKAQMKWMFAKMPEMAERWAKETKDPEALPEHVIRKALGKKKGKGYGKV